VFSSRAAAWASGLILNQSRCFGDGLKSKQNTVPVLSPRTGGAWGRLCKHGHDPGSTQTLVQSDLHHVRSRVSRHIKHHTHDQHLAHVGGLTEHKKNMPATKKSRRAFPPFCLVRIRSIQQTSGPEKLCCHAPARESSCGTARSTAHANFRPARLVLVLYRSLPSPSRAGWHGAWIVAMEVPRPPRPPHDDAVAR
jgi:hypothetical protein